MEYNFRETEKKWQQYWAEKKTFRAENNSDKPKYYVLDMFPYPSGAGLHVGHPLGYIASDIYSRYKRLKGFNVLHPMGWDAFGLPAEQYAIQTGQHPAVTTKNNIARYREQMDKIGFSFDWEREINTSYPEYYKWTQWIFLKLFNSWYNSETDKAENIETLIPKLKLEIGNWDALSEKEKSEVLMDYRLAYRSEGIVNWCPALGTVLANDEVKDGVSERGGYPVERKVMKQWSMRITDYAERLLNDLETIDWSDSIKEQQRNWIGKSEGASVKFAVGKGQFAIEIFTTRPDTIFGATYMTLAPEHELVEKITSAEQRDAVIKYVDEAKNRSDRERMADVKKISGVFTGAYAINPFTEKEIPVWVGDYVLAGYGTGAVMAVPAHDTRDFAFAKHFNLPITKVIEPPTSSSLLEKGLGDEASYDDKAGTLINSGFLNGLEVKDAIKKIIAEIETRGLGKGKVNYRLRDAAFGRQRYWGEPIPIYYKDGIATAVDEKDLPVILPEVDKYLPTEDGEPPLARAKNWKYKNEYEYETTTMPGWAGSSWYFLRYMDAHNEKEFVNKDAVNYWQNVDLYVGGAEHATGHLLYVRFWTKFLFDLGLIPVNEPAKKLINQGMILGISEKIYSPISWSEQEVGRNEDNTIIFWNFQTNIPHVDEIIESHFKKYMHLKISKEKVYGNEEMFRMIVYVSAELIENKSEFIERNLYVGLCQNSQVNIEEFISTNGDNRLHIFVTKNGLFINTEFFPLDEQKKQGVFLTKPEVEKMSKSKLNVENPDDIVEQHGADALRLYEMFLGPLELPKPWNTNGISGTSNFIRKLWRLYHQTPNVFSVSDEEPDRKELKSLHKLIKKVTEDIERFSFNTSVSNFMICVNELTDLKCNKRAILEPLAVLVSPYAPHIAEELWQLLGHKESITFAKWIDHNPDYLEESSFAYPISINGKTKVNVDLSLSLSKEDIEREVLGTEAVQKFLQGQTPKKVIVVPGRIVNIVI